MKLTARPPSNPAAATRAAAAQYRRDLRRAAIVATDRASKGAQRGVQERIRSAGLGKLDRAVGQTSMLREGDNGREPYGVIFARGGDDTLGGGALEAYSRGATIRPTGDRQWLAIPTKAVPRFIMVGGQRRRLTPALYMRSGLVQSIGPLEFRPIGGDKAIWVIKRVSVSPKTGRAKALGPRRTRSRVVQKEVVAFVGIRVTSRAQRFDKDGEVQAWARKVPQFMADALGEIEARRSVT